MSYNPFPHFDFDYSPAALQRLRDQFDDSYDMVTMAALTAPGINVLENRKGFVPRVNLRYRLFDDGWMLYIPRSQSWVTVDIVGGGGAFAQLTRGIVKADALIDGPHPTGTEIEATQVDNMIQPGFSQAAGLIHLDVHDNQLDSVPRVANYDVHFSDLPTIYMDGYQGKDDAFYPFLMDNAALYAGEGEPFETVKLLRPGAQRDYLEDNAHRLRAGVPHTISRRHNQTPHGGAYVPIDAPKAVRKPFHRVAVIRPEGVPLTRVL